MKLANYLRFRGRRGWGISALGPNEARVLFDLLLAAGASIATFAFLRTFFPATSAPILGTVLFLPGSFLACNAVLGIYSYLKLAPSTRKGFALGGSVAITGVLASLVGLPPAVIALWVLLTLPTAIIARLLLCAHGYECEHDGCDECLVKAEPLTKRTGVLSNCSETHTAQSRHQKRREPSPTLRRRE